MLLLGSIALMLFVLPSPWGPALVVAAAIAEVAELFLWRRFLDRYRVRTGAEGLVGEAAEVIEPCDPIGRVRLRGELWNARAGERLEAGETVRIAGVEGLTLEVERVNEPRHGKGPL